MFKAFKTRTLAIAVSLLMALGVIGTVGFAGLTASAEAAGTIGYGPNAAAKYEVSYSYDGQTGEDHYVTDSGYVASTVEAGQYFLYADVTNSGLSEYTYSGIYLYASLGEKDEYEYEVQYYFNYIPGTTLYYTMLEVNPGDEVTLKANYYDYEGALDVELYLGNLQLGAINDNSLYGVRLPAALQLDVAGRYILAVGPEYGYEVEGKLYAQLDNGEPVELVQSEAMDNYYVADVTVAENQILNIYATGNDDLVVNVILYSYVTPVPFGEEVELDAYASVVLEYTHTGSNGYYQLTEKTVDADGYEAYTYYSVVVKESANALAGEYLYDFNYPVYLEAGRTYYFQVSNYGFDTVYATFGLTLWTSPVLAAYEMVYAPVSLNGSQTAYKLDVSELSGSYYVNLALVPENVTTVTLHYGENTTDIVYADYSYMSEAIDLNGVSEMWLTADEQFVAGVFLEEYVTPRYIKVGAKTTVTLEAGAAEFYYLQDVITGSYSITVTAANSNVMIMDYINVIVAEGETYGTFEISSDYSVYVDEFALIFVNNNYFDSESITVIVEKIDDVLTLGVGADITLSAEYNTRTYYIDLEAGDYIITLDFGGSDAQVVVAVNGDEFMDAGDVEGNLYAEGGRVALTFIYVGDSITTFNVIVTAA